jgi:biopolymer transport protein ExbB/TolQ
MFPQLAMDPVNAAMRASRRSAAVVRQDFAQGMTGLATVVCIAPWVGLLGNLHGIMDSFRGGGGEKSAMLAALAAYLSLSLWTTLWGSRWD